MSFRIYCDIVARTISQLLRKSMPPEAVKRWIAEMKRIGLAKSEGQCAKLLGVSPNTMTKLKRDGGDRRTALACRALRLGLEPYD